MNYKGRKKLKNLVVFVSLILFSVVVNSAPVNSGDPALVTNTSMTSSYYLAERANALMFKLEGVSTVGGCPVSGGLVYFIIDGNDKTMISYVLAAKMSKQTIRVHVASDTDLLTGWCRVWAIDGQ